MKSWLKITLFIIFGGLFIVSIPFQWQNSNDYEQVENAIAKANKTIDKICDSGCKDYPQDWVKSGSQLEAENYCLRQCQDKTQMKKTLEESISSSFLYRSKNHRNVGVIYCLLGLRCLPK